MRPIDTLLYQYSSDHQNATNQWIHVICVPAIAWSVSAMLWAIPAPTAFFRPGVWAALAMFGAWAYCWQLSKKLSIGLLAIFVGVVFLNRWIADTYGVMNLLWLGVGVFVVAWIGQFIGHKIEGKRPSFFTDLIYLLVGPIWTLNKLYTRLGVGH